MKYRLLPLAIALAALILSACRTADIKSGIYAEDKSERSRLQIEVTDPQGNQHKLYLKPFDLVTVKAVYTQPLPNDEAGYFVQINVQASAPKWYEESILLIVAKKPYFELARSHSMDGTITLNVRDKAEATAIERALSKLSKR